MQNVGYVNISAGLSDPTELISPPTGCTNAPMVEAHYVSIHPIDFTSVSCDMGGTSTECIFIIVSFSAIDIVHGVSMHLQLEKHAARLEALYFNNIKGLSPHKLSDIELSI